MKVSHFSIANKNRSWLIDLITDGKIAQDDIARAVELAELAPTPQAWHRLIDRMLIWLGALLLAFALLFFVAYNWSGFGNYSKFALIEVLLIGTVGLYWLWHDDLLKSRVTLLVASILTGVLLALFGQTYQTGADPWELFFNWALLITPWVVISRFSVLWVVWLALLNLSILLYINTFGPVFRWYLPIEELLFWILFLLNTTAWVIWELASKRFAWLDDGWSLRLIAFASSTAITWLMLATIVEKSNLFTLIAWVSWLISIYTVYRRFKTDLFMLTIYSFSLGTVFITFLVYHVASADTLGSLLLIGLIIIGISTALTLWLKSVYKEKQHAKEK